MPCTPYTPPGAGPFITNTQGFWNNANQTAGDRSVSYSGGTLTATGPNGSTNFFAGGSQIVRHKFFGSGNFLAVLKSDTGSGPIQHWMSIVDFTASSITSQLVLNVSSDSGTSLPFVQHSQGTGSACLVGAPTPFGMSSLAIWRSDTGKLICAGPPPFNATQQISAEATATNVIIKHGGNTIGGPCPFPSGSLDVQPNNQTFSDVKLGGCPQPPSTKQFTLKNTGDDCLTVSAIAASGPYSVTSQSTPFPAHLAPNETMTVTVTFAPAAIGTFNNVNLMVTRAPAKGEDKLICSGKAVTAQPALAATPGTVNFGHILVGSTEGPKIVTVKNTGDVQISVSVAGSPAGSPFQWTGFNGNLTCGAQQTIAVTFTPPAEGPFNSTMTVIGTPGGTKTVALTGEGCVPNATIVAPPAPFPAYGDVRQSYRMVRYITVKNSGDDTLSFTATISGPDAALFGLLQSSMSITDVVASRNYEIHPVMHCGGGPTGDGEEEVAIAFFANATPPKTATATLTLDSHNDPTAPASFVYTLTANVIEGNTVDVVAVFDTSGSMGDAVPGGGNKMGAAIQAGRLLVKLIPPDLKNRLGATHFATTATTFLPIEQITGANQQPKTDAIKDPPLTPNGWTAIAAGAMVGVKEFAVPHPGGTPTNLTRAMIVLTDGIDNTAYKNPDDGQFYTILGQMARDPGNLSSFIPTNPFVPPSDVRIYAIGLGTGQDIDKNQLDKLSSATGAYYGVVDPTSPAVAYQLMKYYTQIYMDMVDLSVISDPKYVINPGEKHVIEFDLLRGDVGAMVVIYDLGGLRLPFYLEAPQGELIDAAYVPAGFQLRSGFTETTRFLDFRVPLGDPDRYAGRWKVIIVHNGKVCRGRPVEGGKEPGFLPRDCGESKSPVEYGIAIGAGSNFRLQAYVTPGPVHVGEPILLTGVVTEAGLRVPGCTVTVEWKTPGGQTGSLTLADDGAHQDDDPNDGEYARPFTNTPQAGSYDFVFRAVGYTRDGEPVVREAMRSKYVEGYVRPPDHGTPGGGDGNNGGGKDDCCEKLLRVLNQHTQLLRELIEKKG